MTIIPNLFIIYSQIFLIVFFLISSGFLFQKTIINNDHKLNFGEDGLFGFILVGFLSLFFNFFTPLTLIFNSIIFVLVTLISLRQGLYKNINKNFLVKIIITSFICFLLLIFSTVNRPDAWLYHLPYSKIINEHKIIFGVANIHARFAHISIFQYISSFFYNYLFFKNGILIPIALVVSFFFIFIYNEFIDNFKIKKFRIYSFLVYLILIFSLYAFNRYSEFGNDAQAHLYYFVFIIILFKSTILKKYDDILIKRLFFLSLFLFLIKPTFLLVSLIPLILLFLNKNKKKIYKSLSFFVYSFFLILWLLKNIFTNGCLIYPINITCSDKIFWKTYDISVNSVENEAWSKGWPDFKSNKKINQSDFSKNFNWVETWIENHFKFIVEKILPIIIFLILNFLILYFTKSLKKNLFDKTHIYIFLFSFFFLLIWFLKFPLYRLGISQIFLFLILSAYFLFIKNIDVNKFHKYFNQLRYLIFFVILIVSLKNIVRISNNLDNSVMPNMYFSNQKDVVKVYNENNIFTHFRPSENNLCGYISSPCSHLSKNLLVKNFWNYRIFYKKDIK